MRCGTCKYWSTTMIRNHGSYVYGRCLNKKGKFDVITEYDECCDNHSQKQLTQNGKESCSIRKGK